MVEVLYWIIGLGPYFATALALGLIVGLASPWLLKYPDRWLFFAVLGFNLLPFTGGDPSGSTFKQVTWGSLFLLGGFHALRDERGRWTFPTGLIPLPLAVLLLYALVSVLWSPSHLVSFKRAVELVGVLIVAVAIMRRAPRGTDILDLLPAPTAAFILLGLLLAVAAPGFAFDSDHALKAMTSQKNSWGEFSLLASIVYLIVFLQGGRRTWLKGLMLLLCVGSLMASRSMTSILSFLALAGVALTWLLATRARAIGWLILGFALSALIIAFLVYTVLNGQLPFERLIDLFFYVTGKTPTLTGRTFLWQLLLDQIRLHPWFGIGYGGFWVDDGNAAKAVIMHLDWGPPNQAHNGYIDVVNDIGYVGAALLFVVFARHIANLVGLYRLHQGRLAAFHAALLFSALIINYAESSFIRNTDFWWILLCISIVATHAHVRRYRQGVEVTAPLESKLPPLYGASTWA